LSRMRIVTFKLDEETLEKLDELARSVGVPRSELIRKAIEDFLRKREPPKIPYKVIKLWS